MPAKATFQFLDVGMGDSTLVQVRPSGANYDELMLVDFGEKRTPFKVPYRDAMDYLVKTIGDNSHKRGKLEPYLDYLVITHPDGDHYNKIWELVNADFPNYATSDQLHIGRVLFSGSDYEYKGLIKDLRTVTTRKIEFMEDNYHCEIDIVDGPQPDLEMGGDKVKVYILSANWPRRRGATNPKSMVLLFEIGGKKVILPGDATDATEAHIIDAFDLFPAFLQSHALKLGHHGSKGSSSPEWIDAVKPKAIFASGDWFWSHPYCAAICRYIDKGVLGNDTVDRWYSCGDGGVYFNNKTRKLIQTNLSYFVKSDKGEKLIDEATKKEFQGPHLNAFGVQWAMQITEAGNVTYLRTDTVKPAPKQKIPPAFDCTSVMHDEAVTIGTPLAAALLVGAAIDG